ncbi:MAG: PhnD/SsuA/transferrin family substrate-binding protein [Candidatus Schekmanbacteria bacterium]|nr:PhnD/SsuA/transferrin family substrate-binding protein [Candidatus Schekmanbacteria bacterium]
MKLFCSHVLFVACLSLAASALAEDLPRSKFVVLSLDSSGLNEEDVKEGLEKYHKFFEKQAVIDLEPLYFDKTKDIEAAFEQWRKEGAMPMYGVLPSGYLLYKGYQFGYEPLVCAQRDGSKTMQLSLIARRGSQVKNLQDANGTKISMTNTGGEQVAWTNITAFDEKVRLEKYFGEVVSTDGPTESVMAVIFRTTDVALVSKQLFERMSEKAAMIWREVREIYTSEPLTMVCVVKWAGAPDDLSRRFADTLTGNMGEMKGGDVVLDAFFIDGFEPCDWAELEQREGKHLQAVGLQVVSGEQRAAAIRSALAPPGATPAALPAEPGAAALPPSGEPESAAPTAPAAGEPAGSDGGSAADAPGVALATAEEIETSVRLDSMGSSIVVIAKVKESLGEVKDIALDYQLDGKKGQREGFSPWTQGRYLCPLVLEGRQVSTLDYEVVVSFANGTRLSSGKRSFQVK